MKRKHQEQPAMVDHLAILRSLLAVFILGALTLKSSAQVSPGSVSNAALAEKIYLQPDRQVYFNRDTIWYKCIVASAYNHKPTTLSSVLTVELVAPTEKVIIKRLIKLTDGVGSGYFPIDVDYPEGTYQIRAYTQWDQNFGSDFVYAQYVSVISNRKQKAGVPITDVALVKMQGEKQQLKANFDPLSIDSLHSGKLLVFITAKGKTDTLVVNKGINGKYDINYSLSDNYRFVTLGMQTSYNAKFTKSVLLDKDYTDLQFFPESGELVHGLPSKVGFKAVDVNGKGVFVKGDIVDANDKVLTQFESNALGMGSFYFSEADSTKTYYARMDSKIDTSQLILVPLPKASPLGNTLSVEKKAGKMLLIAESNYLTNATLNLIVSCRGIVYSNQKITLNDGIWGGVIPSKILPEGIIACTLVDSNQQPIAERLFFNQRPEDRLNIELATNKNKYAKREQTNLTIKTVGSDGKPANASLSVLAINKAQLGEIQNKRQNILSYFLLDSELKGEIENLGFYFNEQTDRDNDLDALLLTQGWRKYLYSKPFEFLPFKPQRNLSVKGRVTGNFTDKSKAGAKLTMMTFGNGIQAGATSTDSTGRFRFELGDEFGDEMEVVIQSSKKSGRKVNYTVNLDKSPSPPVQFTTRTTIDKLDSVVVELVKKDIERKKIETAYRASDGTIMLTGVDVVERKRTETSKRIIKEAGTPIEILDGKKLLEVEKDWSYGLFNVLSFNATKNIDIFMNDDLELQANVYGSDMTLVLVDGEYERLFMDLVATLPTSEVSSIDVIKCAHGFEKIYLEKTGEVVTELITCGSIININTKAGKGLFGAYYDAPIGINRFRLPVFATPKQYYTPSYNNPSETNWNQPDLRQVLHFEPLLNTNETGMASTSFYNSDHGGKMVIVVEAISKNGEIGYQTTEYNVEGKQAKVIIVN